MILLQKKCSRKLCWLHQIFVSKKKRNYALFDNFYMAYLMFVFQRDFPFIFLMSNIAACKIWSKNVNHIWIKSGALVDLVLFFPHYIISWTISISGFSIPNFNSLLQWTILPSACFCEVYALANLLYLK